MSAGLLLGGRYELQVQLGAGGFGSVWRGRDNTLLREVAVKLVQFESDADSAARDVATQRFLREAQAVAGLNHPNVVAAYDFGVQDDTAYLVMELVHGASLAQQARRRREQGLGPMDVPTVVRVAIEICAGLGVAHRAGLVHRDLKPANVMIVDPSGQVKIVDFGIARVADRSRLTRTGSYMGTLPYIAPEQMSTAGMDGRADIYSLGCLLHELLTGRSPYVAESPVQWLAAHQYAEPARLTAHLPGAPLALERLILDMLAKDPEARPATAEAVQERLAAIRTAPAGGADPMALPVPGMEPPPDRPATSPPLLPPGRPVPLVDVTSVAGTEAVTPPPSYLPAAAAEAAPMHLPVSGPPVTPPVSAPPAWPLAQGTPPSSAPPAWPPPQGASPASAPPASAPPLAIPLSVQPATNPPLGTPPASAPPLAIPLSGQPGTPPPVSGPPAGPPPPPMHLPLGTPTPASAPPVAPTSVPPLFTPQTPPSTPPLGTTGGYPPGPRPPGFGAPPPAPRRGSRTAVIALVIAIIVVIAGTAVLLGPLHLLSSKGSGSPNALTTPTTTPVTPSGTASNPNSGGAACHLKIAYLGTRNSAFGTRDDAEIGGMNLALTQYNQQHPGCPVTAATFDTNPSNLANPPASVARAAATKLIADASIVGVIGPATSGDAGSVAGTMKAAGIGWISPSATSDDLPGLGGGTFHRAIGGRAILNNTMAGYIASLSGAKVFLVDDGSTFGKQLTAAVQAAAPGSVVGSDRVATEGRQTDFSGTVTKVMNDGATIVVYGGYAQNAGRLLNQLRAAGSAAKFFLDDVTDQPDFARLAGSASTAGSATFFCLCDVPVNANPTFATAYAAANGGKQPNLYADIAFDMTNMMLAGIQAGKITRADMLSYLASASYQGPVLKYKFNADGTLDPTDIVAYRFTDNGSGGTSETPMNPVLP